MKTVRNEPEIVLRNGKPTAVILPLKHYEALLERAEDVEDVRWLRQRRKQKTNFRTLEEFLAAYAPDV
jgi:prevent-host-death family protein